MRQQLGKPRLSGENALMSQHPSDLRDRASRVPHMKTRAEIDHDIERRVRKRNRAEIRARKKDVYAISAPRLSFAEEQMLDVQADEQRGFEHPGYHRESHTSSTTHLKDTCPLRQAKSSDEDRHLDGRLQEVAVAQVGKWLIGIPLIPTVVSTHESVHRDVR